MLNKIKEKLKQAVNFLNLNTLDKQQGLYQKVLGLVGENKVLKIVFFVAFVVVLVLTQGLDVVSEWVMSAIENLNQE